MVGSIELKCFGMKIVEFSSGLFKVFVGLFFGVLKFSMLPAQKKLVSIRMENLDME